MATPQTKRQYQVWRGSNRFLCGGRLIFGPEVALLFLSTLLIAVPAAAFCLEVGLKIKADHNFLWFPVLAGAVIVTISDFIFLFLTSSRDPGIVPRNSQSLESEEALDMATPSMEWIHGRTPHLRIPRTKDVIVNGIVVRVKYCDTCLLYRPPRTSHCSICDNCVQRFDHHCPWVGQCIGLRNYQFFFLFIASSTFLCIYVFTFSLLNILKYKEDSTSWNYTMSKQPLSVVLILYCFVAVWFVGGLTLYHLYLISTNQTTYENFRNRYDKKENPHNRGILRNFKELLFSSIPPSMNDFRSWVLEDHIDTGSVTPSIGGDVGSKDKIDIEMGSSNPENGTSILIPEILQILNDNGIDDKVKSKDWNEDSAFLPSLFPISQEVGDSKQGSATTLVDQEPRDSDLGCSTTLVNHDLRDCHQSRSTTPVNHDQRDYDQGCTKANEAKVAGGAGEGNLSNGTTPTSDDNLTLQA